MATAFSGALPPACHSGLKLCGECHSPWGKHRHSFPSTEPALQTLGHPILQGQEGPKSQVRLAGNGLRQTAQQELGTQNRTVKHKATGVQHSYRHTRVEGCKATSAWRDAVSGMGCRRAHHQTGASSWSRWGGAQGQPPPSAACTPLLHLPATPLKNHSTLFVTRPSSHVIIRVPPSGG